ncbi:hypothetical protein HHK36_020062 [Tetracentron sinense]|uniref:G-patch domain-containing protein n=1 Tax=Tetracentron sinense TaxID=13715 RepID=A0A834YQZ0_TETSI|nr:hypothetical protein HHK36_020062 [Tetracentron sinense]
MSPLLPLSQSSSVSPQSQEPDFSLEPQKGRRLEGKIGRSKRLIRFVPVRSPIVTRSRSNTMESAGNNSSAPPPPNMTEYASVTELNQVNEKLDRLTQMFMNFMQNQNQSNQDHPNYILVPDQPQAPTDQPQGQANPTGPSNSTNIRSLPPKQAVIFHTSGQQEDDTYEEEEWRSKGKQKADMSDQIAQLKSELRSELRSEVRQLKGVDTYGKIDLEDLCQHPGSKMPPKFKCPELSKYNGKGCPLAHLKLYIGSLSDFSDNEPLLLQLFQRSLTEEALDWYSTIDHTKLKVWRDLAEVFLDHFRFNTTDVANRMDVQRMYKKSTETFKQYAHRWRGVAARVKPPMTETEVVSTFISTLKQPYYGYLLGYYASNFATIVHIGDGIDDGIKTGKLADYEYLHNMFEQQTAANATTKRPVNGRRDNGKKEGDVQTVMVNRPQNSYAQPMYTQPSYPVYGQPPQPNYPVYAQLAQPAYAQAVQPAQPAVVPPIGLPGPGNRAPNQSNEKKYRVFTKLPVRPSELLPTLLEVSLVKAETIENEVAEVGNMTKAGRCHKSDEKVQPSPEIPYIDMELSKDQSMFHSFEIVSAIDISVIKEPRLCKTDLMVARVMMDRGFQPGKGLGLNSQGISEPIPETTYIPWFGLGYKPKGKDWIEREKKVRERRRARLEGRESRERLGPIPHIRETFPRSTYFILPDTQPHEYLNLSSLSHSSPSVSTYPNPVVMHETMNINEPTLLVSEASFEEDDWMNDEELMQQLFKEEQEREMEEFEMEVPPTMNQEDIPALDEEEEFLNQFPRSTDAEVLMVDYHRMVKVSDLIYPVKVYDKEDKTEYEQNEYNFNVALDSELLEQECDDDMQWEGKNLQRKEKRVRIDQIRANLGLSDSQRTPMPGESLKDFFKRTNLHWRTAAHEHTQHTGRNSTLEDTVQKLSKFSPYLREGKTRPNVRGFREMKFTTAVKDHRRRRPPIRGEGHRRRRMSELDRRNPGAKEFQSIERERKSKVQGVGGPAWV